MSAIGGKADALAHLSACPLIARSGHPEDSLRPEIHPLVFDSLPTYGGFVVVTWEQGIPYPKLRAHHAKSLLVGAVLAATILLAVNAVAQPTDDEAIDVVFKVNSQLVILSDDVRGDLRSQADKIVRRCGYDGGDREEQVWREALPEPSSIRLVYAKPIELRLPRREILISEAVFSLRNANLLGQPILHHEGRTTLVFKCDGTDMLHLMCMPELEVHFPPGYQGNCHIVRQR